MEGTRRKRAVRVVSGLARSVVYQQCHLIAGKIAEEPSARIHIIADRNTPYKHINDVVSVLQLLQYRVVSFVVREELS